MAIFTAIATAIFAGTALAGTFIVTATAFALQIAAGIGLSYLAKAVAGQPSAATTTPFSTEGKLQAGGDLPRSFNLGYSLTGGSLVYANTWSPSPVHNPNAYLVQVIALSDLPVQSLEQVWVNGVLCTVDTNSANDSGFGHRILEYTKNGTDHLWVKFYDGTQTAADAYLVSILGSDANHPYQSTRVGLGCAYVIVASLVDDTLFTGFPTFKFATNGMRLYDPSQDTTVGGSGSHRYSDPTTWGGDGDFLPAVQIYNLLRGVHYGSSWLYGLQNISPARLPTANWIAQINKCRTTITGPNGAEPTYRSGGQISVSAQVVTAVEALLTACQGKIAEAGGVYKIHVGVSDSSVFSITDDLIISTQTQSFTPFYGLADTVNGISGSYPEPIQGWNSTVAPPVYNSTYETQDGSRRLMADVSFDLVPYLGQVQRLMKSSLAEARRARRNTFTLPPEAWALEPGDIITWTSARNSYTSKLFRVDGVIDNPNLDVVVDLTEVDPTDYSWNFDTQFVPATYGPTIAMNYPPAQSIGSFAATGVIIVDNNGFSRRPAIQLTWDGTVSNISGVAYEVRNAFDQVVINRGTTSNYAAGGIIISESLLPNTDYEARGQYIPVLPRDMLWSSWLAVTTPDVRLSLADFDAALTGLVNTSINDANTRIAEIADLIAEVQTDQDAANRLDKHTVRNDLAETTATTNASIAVVQTYAAGIDAAFASYVVTVNASLGTLSASVTTNATAISNLNSSFSSYTTTTNASIGTLTSSVSTNSTAIATVAGKVAGSYTVILDTNGYVSSLKAYNDGSASSWTFVGSIFQIAFPSTTGGSPTTIFQVSTVNGTPAITLKGNIYADGDITARTIATGAITAIKVQAGSITADRLTAHTIDASVIAVGAITSNSGAIGALSVKSLSIGDAAVTVPSTGVGAASSGASAYQYIVNYGVTVDTTGLDGKTISFVLTYTGQQGVSGSGSWFAGCGVNGTLLNAYGGSTFQPAFSATSVYSFTVGAGQTSASFSVQGMWWGQSGVYSLAAGSVLSVMGAKR